MRIPRKLLFAVPALALAAAAIFPARPVAAAAAVVPAKAQPAEPDMAISNCTYYNNANHTQVVGQFGYDCCNNPVAWGRKTQFKECGGCFPCIPPPR